MPIVDHFERNGIVIVEYALLPADIARMAEAFAHPGQAGDRHAWIEPGLLQWLRSHPVLATLAERLAGAHARLVRVIAFDKSPQANWFVPWHQNRSIAVARRIECAGFTNWTVRDGEVQVEPPIEVLETMVTLRVHLDDCGEDDGPLEVLPGSHRQGRLDRSRVAALAETAERKLCLATRGDILAMRPLLVHRSQKAKVPKSRRVLHLEYATAPLPPVLSWSIDGTTA